MAIMTSTTTTKKERRRQIEEIFIGKINRIGDWLGLGGKEVEDVKNDLQVPGLCNW